MTEHQHADRQLTEQLIEEQRKKIANRIRAFVSEAIESRETAFRLQLDDIATKAGSNDLKIVADALQSLSIPGPESEWFSKVQFLFNDIPESVVLPQGEPHFASVPSDPFVINLQKGVKRLNRSVRKGMIGTGNAVRGIFKKEKKEWMYPVREIPLQHLMILASTDLLESLHSLEVLLMRRHAAIFESVFRWHVQSPTEEPEAVNDLSDVFDGLKAGFEDDMTAFREETGNRLDLIDQRMSDMIAKAGTVELRNSRFAPDEIQQKAGAAARRYAPVLEQWMRCNELLKERVGTMIQALELTGLIQKREDELLGSVKSFFSGFRKKPQDRLRELLDEAMESLTSGGTPSPMELKIKSEEIAGSVGDHVRDSVLNVLQAAIDEDLLNKAVSAYAEDLLGLTDQQPDKVILSEHTDLTKETPVFEEIRIEWQRVIHIMIADFIASELLSDSFDPGQELKTITGAFDEIAQIISTNLKLVEEITHEEDQKPADIAIDGINRAILKYEEAAAALEQMQESILHEITGKRKAFHSELMEFLNKDDFGNVTWVQTQLRVKESAGDWKVKWTVAWAGFMSRIDLFRRFIGRKYGIWSGKVRVFLGKERIEGLKSERINLATFLHETSQKFKQLPFIYRRLFDFQRVIDTNLYVRKPHHFEQVKKSFSLWQDGFPSSIVITGEVGSGKKTLISFLQTEILSDTQSILTFSETIWKEEEVLSQLSNALELPPVATEEELIEYIRTKRMGSIVVVENLHNCFIRAMSGYAGLRLLLSVIAETRKEIFWVVTSYKYAWNFLQVYMNIADHFSHAVTTDQLTTDEIRNLIMKRQKASGYAYRFLPTPDTEHSRTYKKLLDDDAEQQKYLAGKYFEKLSAIADGNATVAIIYWVRSIVDFSDHEVQLRALDTTGMELIGSLEPTILFAISSFLLHGSLSTEELSLGMNSSLPETEMIVSRLKTNGLLVEKNGNYSLNLLIYRQVVRVLKSKNMLH